MRSGRVDIAALREQNRLLKERYRLEDSLPAGLRKVTASEYHGPCPFCGGSDRFAANVREQWWFCRQCHPKRADVLEYLRLRDGVSFSDLVARLTGKQPKQAQAKEHPPMASPAVQRTPRAAPPASWQEAASEVAAEAAEILWSPAGQTALGFLYKRGLSDDTILLAELGYIPRDTTIAGLKVPAGIVIPWRYDGVLWQLKVRRRSGTSPKYMAVAGGHPFVYAPMGLPKSGALVLVEGEFDALLVQQELRVQHGDHLASVATLGSGSISGYVLDHSIRSLLERFDPILLALDNDEQGKAGTRALHQQLRDVAPCPLPSGKDATEFHLAGGRIRAWIEANLEAERYRRAEDEPDEATYERSPDMCDWADCQRAPFVERDLSDESRGAYCSEHWICAQVLDAAGRASFAAAEGICSEGLASWLAYVQDADLTELRSVLEIIDASVQDEAGEAASVQSESAETESTSETSAQAVSDDSCDYPGCERNGYGQRHSQAGLWCLGHTYAGGLMWAGSRLDFPALAGGPAAGPEAYVRFIGKALPFVVMQKQSELEQRLPQRQWQTV